MIESIKEICDCLYVTKQVWTNVSVCCRENEASVMMAAPFRFPTSPFGRNLQSRLQPSADVVVGGLI